MRTLVRTPRSQDNDSGSVSSNRSRPAAAAVAARRRTCSSMSRRPAGAADGAAGAPGAADAADGASVTASAGSGSVTDGLEQRALRLGLEGLVHDRLQGRAEGLGVDLVVLRPRGGGLLD